MRVRPVSLAIALPVVGVLGVCAFGLYAWRASDAARLPDLAALALPALRTNWAAADRIELVHGTDVLWLERRGQVWGLSQEGGYPISTAAAEALAEALLTLHLLHPADGTPEALGLGDPPDPAGGTAVRVLSVRGAVLGSLVTRPGPGPALVRRPRDPQSWVADHPIPVSLDPADWADRHLPPIERTHILELSRDGEPAVDATRDALAAVAFTAARAAPQVRLGTPLTVLSATLVDGTAMLTIGRLDGQLWLRVSGTSPWAASLAPYAFALPDDARLVAP